MNYRKKQSSSLGSALFTDTQQQVLGILYGQPHQSFYMKQILRLTGMGVHTIKRELDRMVKTGILTLTKIGNQHHFQANPECPIYHELLAIVRKTFGITAVLKTALKPINEKVELAFVYGSVAKAEDTGDSDIDLMLVGRDLVYAEVMDKLTKAEELLGRPINPTIYDTDQISGRIKKRNSFVQRVMDQTKLWIKGEENDIGAFR